MTPLTIKHLEGFHMRATFRMACVNKPRRELDSSWAYSFLKNVLEEVALYSIAYYVEVRWQTIAKFIVSRPLFYYCREGRRNRGPSPRQWWWEQPMDLDAARDAALVADAVAADD